MRRFSVDEFIWFIILILLIIFNVYLLYSGEIYNFINGNMLKVYCISVIILGIFAVFQIKMIFTIPIRNNFTNKFIPLILLFVVAVVFFMPVIMNRTTDYDFYQDNPSEEILKIDSSNYHFIDEIEEMPILYQDKLIQMTGFIYLEDNKFYLAREELSCCQWDIHMIKIPIQGKDFSSENGKWVTVLGKVTGDEPLSLDIIDFKFCPEPDERFFHERL